MISVPLIAPTNAVAKSMQSGRFSLLLCKHVFCVCSSLGWLDGLNCDTGKELLLLVGFCYRSVGHIAVKCPDAKQFMHNIFCLTIFSLSAVGIL